MSDDGIRECSACEQDSHDHCTGTVMGGFALCDCDLNGHPDHDSESGLLA